MEKKTNTNIKRGLSPLPFGGVQTERFLSQKNKSFFLLAVFEIKLISRIATGLGGEIMLEDIETLDVEVLLQLQEFYPELFEEIENL